MIRFLKALILLPVAILVVLLAVANRHQVTLSLDPFSQEAPEFATQLPLFAVIFAAVMLGVVIGGVAAWLAQGKNRSGLNWFLLSLPFGPIATFVLVVFMDKLPEPYHPKPIEEVDP